MGRGRGRGRRKRGKRRGRKRGEGGGGGEEEEQEQEKEEEDDEEEDSPPPPPPTHLPSSSSSLIEKMFPQQGSRRCHSPVYSGKQSVRGDLTIFSAKRSFLLRKRMMEVSSNHRLLQMESNSLILSFIRF